MDLLLNDLSLAGQFPNSEAFRSAVTEMMKLRAVAERYGRDIYCTRQLANVQVTPSENLPQVLSGFQIDQRRALTAWLTRQGPFWDDQRRHDGGEYFECKGEVVTDSAIGEAAYRNHHGIDHDVVSFPHVRCCNVFPVMWFRDPEPQIQINVRNYCNESALEAALQAATPPLASWGQMAEVIKVRFTNLTFLPDCFEPLRRQPFIRASADRIVSLCNTINKIHGCFDSKNQRTEEWNRLFRDHFSGQGVADFSDSSDTEKKRL